MNKNIQGDFRICISVPLTFLEVNNGGTCSGQFIVIIQKTMSPRKSGEDVMIKLCQSWEGHKQSFACILQNIDAIKNFANFIGKHLCWSLLLIKF